MSAKDPRARIRSALDAHRAAKDPVELLDAARVLREAADELESAAIDAARRAGATWSTVGELYGLTKQGAQQRFKPKGTGAKAVQEKGSRKRT